MTPARDARASSSLGTAVAAAAGEASHMLLGRVQQDVLVIAQDRPLETLPATLQRLVAVEGEEAAGLAGLAAGGENLLQRGFVPHPRLGKGAEGEREVA